MRLRCASSTRSTAPLRAAARKMRPTHCTQRTTTVTGYAGLRRACSNRKARPIPVCPAVGQHLASICSVMQLDEERYTCVQSTHEHSVRGLHSADGSASIPDVRKPSPGETWAGNSTSARSANATGKNWRRHIFVEAPSPLAAARPESRGSDQDTMEACAGSGITEETVTSDDIAPLAW